MRLCSSSASPPSTPRHHSVDPKHQAVEQTAAIAWLLYHFCGAQREVLSQPADGRRKRPEGVLGRLQRAAGRLFRQTLFVSGSWIASFTTKL